MIRTKEIRIGKDFSHAPLGRFPSDGKFNGETFRKRLLVPALKENSTVTVIIDDVEGYGSSFLEEAFGGLVRDEGFSEADLNERLKISYDDQRFKLYASAIKRHIKAADRAVVA